jgi:hypothetical protein
MFPPEIFGAGDIRGKKFLVHYISKETSPERELADGINLHSTVPRFLGGEINHHVIHLTIGKHQEVVGTLPILFFMHKDSLLDQYST